MLNPTKVRKSVLSGNFISYCVADFEGCRLYIYHRYMYIYGIVYVFICDVMYIYIFVIYTYLYVCTQPCSLCTVEMVFCHFSLYFCLAPFRS